MSGPVTGAIASKAAIAGWCFGQELAAGQRAEQNRQTATSAMGDRVSSAVPSSRRRTRPTKPASGGLRLDLARGPGGTRRSRWPGWLCTAKARQPSTSSASVISVSVSDSGRGRSNSKQLAPTPNQLHLMRPARARDPAAPQLPWASLPRPRDVNRRENQTRTTNSPSTIAQAAQDRGDRAARDAGEGFRRAAELAFAART